MKLKDYFDKYSSLNIFSYNLGCIYLGELIMSNDLNFYINGEWVKSESNETIDVINPANEEVIGQVTAGTKEDIDKAVSAALDAFSSFQQTTKAQRIELLNNIITNMKLDMMILFKPLLKKWVRQFGYLKQRKLKQE